MYDIKVCLDNWLYKLELYFQVITALYTYAQATLLQKQSFTGIEEKIDLESNEALNYNYI